MDWEEPEGADGALSIWVWVSCVQRMVNVGYLQL
jgi:hypothetical protein